MLLLGSTALVAFLAATGVQAKDDFAPLNLSAGGLSGIDAVRVIGKDLPRLAAQYRKSPEQLRRLLLKDRTLKVARNGRLYYTEDAAQVPASAASDDAILSGTLLPLDQTFSLHSKPGAPRFLILNFQGKTVTGTYWNTVLGRQAIVATPFTLDGNPAAFSDAERTAIQYIWQRVAEDYAAFNVDVTTDINAAAGSPGGTTYATAVITRQGDYFGVAPGVAYVSTFGNPSYEPAFVAYDTLGKNPKYIAEAVSHELGHRLGLDHDGNRNSAYFAGQGTAPMRWAPIMGNSYSADISQFSKGEYAGANNTQDDYLVMRRYLAYKDTVGDSLSEDVPLTPTTAGGTSSATADGVIETQNDVDVYSITAGAGPIAALAKPVAVNPNLDATLTLTDNTGAVLASSTPSAAMNASISANLPRAGVYYLKVSNTGSGTAQSTGFSTYGSRGYYRLTASYPATDATPPRGSIAASAIFGVAPLTVAFDAAGSTSATPITSYAWDLGNGSRSSTRTASTTYTATGTFPVTLKVTNAAGLTNQVVQKITVGKEAIATLSVAKGVNADGTMYAVASIGPYPLDAVTRYSLRPVVYGVWSGGLTGEARGDGWKRSGMKIGSPTARNSSTCITFTVTKMEVPDPASTAPVTDANPKPILTYVPRTPLTASTCSQQVSR